MNNTYGYNPLSYELIRLFRSGAPDFEAAEELIRRGADVNDQGNDKSENVLSEILFAYWYSRNGDLERERCQNCDCDYVRCAGCEYDLNPDLGNSMLKVIRFFLNHGFDVSLDGGRRGAQCLEALALSTFDRSVIDATKLLLDAGAKNIPIGDDPYETPMTSIGDEGCFQDISEQDHYRGNIFEATYQIYCALEAGKPYSEIDSFDRAIGKRVVRIMADGDPSKPIFTTVDIPASKHENCFYCNLYFIYDGGYLVATKEASYWVDNQPITKPLTDVSAYFQRIIGSTILSVSFRHNSICKGTTFYGQPVTVLHMDNGDKLVFTINFGEVEKPDYCSYFYYED